jgi:ABC-type dipeptide/oligopeptide/nickel transport system permease component
MARHLLHPLWLTLPALWLVLTLVFLLIHIVPGDPVEQMLGEGAAPGQVAEMRHALGLDQPLYLQRYPAMLQLAFLALIVCAAIAIPSGMLTAYRLGQTPDHAVGRLSFVKLR